MTAASLRRNGRDYLARQRAFVQYLDRTQFFSDLGESPGHLIVGVKRAGAVWVLVEERCCRVCEF